ncbi:family 32 glycosyltransferase, partial [Melampsora larici-populina 98AG31]
KSWKDLNPNWDYHLSEDKEENNWVNRILSFQESSLLRSWNSLSNEPVMRADLWRYLKLLIVGGVYSDMDTRCLKPIETWMECHLSDHQEIENNFTKNETTVEKSLLDWTYKGTEKPSVIVGIEADVGDRADWEEWWPRPIQLVQWTIAAAPGHPILIDTLRRLVSTLDLPPISLSNSRLFTEKVAESEAERIMRVVKATGPAPFTDAVLRYLGVITRGEVVWNSLRNLPACGLRIGDVLVLPISGFSPG